jgi:hypothetical protein
MDGLGTARLQDEVSSAHAIATIVPRAQIVEALGEPDEPPELLLDLRWREGGGDARTSVALGFSHDDLERLLAETTDDGIVLTFDGDELAMVFEDVEAHGLRERALVFAVAATGAIGSSAAIANAAPLPVTALDGPQPAAVTPAQVSDAASGGGYAAPVQATAGSADRVVTDASSGGGYAAGSVASATGADAMRTDVSSAGGYGTSVGTTGEVSGPMLHVSSGGVGTTSELLIGGAILAIAGAAFAGRRHTGSARPA